MRFHRVYIALIMTLAAALTMAHNPAAAQSSTAPSIKETAGRDAGIKAVIYGLPLLMMDITMQRATGVSRASGVAAPINQFGHMRAPPTAAFKEVVRAKQAAPGKDEESNWLPAPAGAFNITLRMYWPKSAAPSILDGSWKPPGITRLN